MIKRIAVLFFIVVLAAFVIVRGLGTFVKLLAAMERIKTTAALVWSVEKDIWNG